MDIEYKCSLIADDIVPQYRSGVKDYSCSGVHAKRWQAAWDCAYSILSGAQDDRIK